MPNTYKSLGKAKRRLFLDSRARAGGNTYTMFDNLTDESKAFREKQMLYYKQRMEEIGEKIINLNIERNNIDIKINNLDWEDNGIFD